MRVSCYFNMDPVCSAACREVVPVSGVGFLLVALSSQNACPRVEWQRGTGTVLPGASGHLRGSTATAQREEQAAPRAAVRLWGDSLRVSARLPTAAVNAGERRAGARVGQALPGHGGRTAQREALGAQERDSFRKDAQTFFLRLSLSFLALLEPIAPWRIPEGRSGAGVRPGRRTWSKHGGCGTGQGGQPEPRRLIKRVRVSEWGEGGSSVDGYKRT